MFLEILNSLSTYFQGMTSSCATLRSRSSELEWNNCKGYQVNLQLVM